MGYSYLNAILQHRIWVCIGHLCWDTYTVLITLRPTHTYVHPYVRRPYPAPPPPFTLVHKPLGKLLVVAMHAFSLANGLPTRHDSFIPTLGGLIIPQPWPVAGKEVLLGHSSSLIIPFRHARRSPQVCLGPLPFATPDSDKAPLRWWHR